MTSLSGITQGASWALRRAANKQQVDSDMEIVAEYVLKDLFLKVIFIFDHRSLSKGGLLYNDFMLNCRSLIAGGMLQDLSDEEATTYMDILWDRLVKEDRYNQCCAQRRSNAYQSVQDNFTSKLRKLATAC